MSSTSLVSTGIIIPNVGVAIPSHVNSFFKHISTLCLVHLLQTAVSKSISEFMAYVHLNVNEMSKQYLLNERRYNYTTPKSFLELVCDDE